MVSATGDFYARYARRLTSLPEAQRSAMLPHVERALLPGATVLDVGAGSGRDVAALVLGGFDAFGVDPSADMLEMALHLQPSLRDRLGRASLPSLGHPFSERVPGGFDAVICSAVLMHIEPAELHQALDSMVGQLRPRRQDDTEAASPAMLFSLPRIEAGSLIAHRDADGRRFHNHDADDVRDHLATHGFSVAWSEVSDAMLATTGTLWKTIVFRRQA